MFSTTILGQVFLNGLSLSAIYVLIALGFTLLFGIMKVVNFAHGAFAMVGAYLYYELHFVHVHGVAISIGVTVAATALLGVLTDQLLMRRLRRSSALARLIGTMGVLLVIVSIDTEEDNWNRSRNGVTVENIGGTECQKCHY